MGEGLKRSKFQQGAVERGPRRTDNRQLSVSCRLGCCNLLKVDFELLYCRWMPAEPLRLRQEHLAPGWVTNWAFLFFFLVVNCLILEGEFKFRVGVELVPLLP